MAVLSKVAALAALRQIVPERQIISDRDALLTYERDASLDRGLPDAVVLPRSAAEVAALVRWAAGAGLPLIARGAGTGLSGGAVAEHGGVVLHFAHLARICRIDAANRSAVLQPGVVTQDFDLLARREGLYYPPDPSSGRASTIGGNIGENSGGPHCFKYGVTTNYVSGLEVVLADGTVARLGGEALDYPAYDLTGLLVGSEGTLAIVTEATVRLIRNPPAVKTMMAAFASVEAAGAAVSAIIAAGLIPATLEMMDQKIMRIIEDFVPAGLPLEAAAALIVEADGYEASVGPQINEIGAILHAHGAQSLRVAASAAEREAIWYGRKSAAGAMSRLAPAYYLVDVSVPRSRLAEALAAVNEICIEEELRVGYVFHAGDGNLHPLILIDDPADGELVARVIGAGRRIAELCVRYDGSITGEHGVGIEKRAFMPLMYSPAELDTMRDVKAAFDPAGCFNPHKIFPQPDDPLPATASTAGLQANAASESALHISRVGAVLEKENATTVMSTSPDKPSALAQDGPRHSSLLTPSSAEEAAASLRELSAAQTTVRLRGGGTQSGLLQVCDIVMSTTKMNKLIVNARDDLYVTVGAGMPLAALHEALAGDGMFVPLVSPWPQATVGGIVATSLNAPLRMRYGGLRDLVLATRVALPDGRVIRAGRPVVKNVAGYDMPKLFVGAHGTLGLLCDATLKLVPLPRRREHLLIPVHDLQQGIAWGRLLLSRALVASAVVLCDTATAILGSASPYALIWSAEGPVEDVAVELAEARAVLRASGADMVEHHLSGSDAWATWLRAAAALPTGLTLRVGLPQGALPTFAAAHGGQGPLFADLAAGQLYLQGTLDVASIRTAALAAGGYAVILAGVPEAVYGLDRWGYLPAGLAVMRRLKARWNPGGYVNTGAFVV